MNSKYLWMGSLGLKKKPKSKVLGHGFRYGLETPPGCYGGLTGKGKQPRGGKEANVDSKKAGWVGWRIMWGKGGMGKNRSGGKRTLFQNCSHWVSWENKSLGTFLLLGTGEDRKRVEGGGGEYISMWRGNCVQDTKQNQW